MTQPEQPDDRSRPSADWNASAPSQQPSDQAAPGWYQEPTQPAAEPQGYQPAEQYEPIQPYTPQGPYAQQGQYPPGQYPPAQYGQQQYGQPTYGQPQGWAGSMPVTTPKRPVWKTVVGIILIVIGSLGTLGLLANIGSGRFASGGQGAAYGIGYLFGTLLVSLVPLVLGIVLVRSKK